MFDNHLIAEVGGEEEHHIFVQLDKDRLAVGHYLASMSNAR